MVTLDYSHLTSVLSKAYKQMGIAPEHRYLAVIFFKGKQGVPRFYVANSLMFGAAAAVYAFNRVSRSIWWLFNRMLLLPCGVFYDDFPLFSPADLAASADESVFNVLGCQLNLQGVHSGMLVLENKPSRIERMVEFITQLKAKGKVTLHEAQVLHGLLRYSCGFFAGRGLHQFVELYVMVSLRWQLKDLLCDRRSIWRVDNNAARFALIKGLSSSRTMRFLAREFWTSATQPSLG